VDYGIGASPFPQQLAIAGVAEANQAAERARHDVRIRFSAQLDELEGVDANATFQEFLATVHQLAAERRLSRVAYKAAKPTLGG
jgi:hypothetical protein